MTACSACHGYGTADGEPAGNLPRDTYDDPGPCARCGGSGGYTWKAVGEPTVSHARARAFDWVPPLDFIEVRTFRCIMLPIPISIPLCELCNGTGTARGCARHGGQCDGADRGCTDSYPCPCGAGEVEP